MLMCKLSSVGIHAREWISPAFVTWLINELVENYAAHPQYVDNVDWYIQFRKLPLTNCHADFKKILGTLCL